MRRKKLLLILMRNPVLGKIKTRIAESIGEENALKMYYYLLAYTRLITQKIHCDKLLVYDTFIPESDEWDKAIYHKRLARGKDLGEVMYNAFREAFSKKYSQVVIIGSDCPQITQKIIETSFKKLENHDFVLGPAVDGGYYLLGMKHLNKNLFFNKSWSTDKVLSQTLNDIKQLQASVSLLPTLADVDTEEDIKKLKLSWIYEN